MPYIFATQDICPICHAPYAYDHLPIAITKTCSHIYHYACIDQCEKDAYNNSRTRCPECRIMTNFSLVDPPTAILAGVLVKFSAFSSLRDAILKLYQAKFNNFNNLYKALFIRTQFDWDNFTRVMDIDPSNIFRLNDIIYEMLYASMASAYQLTAYKNNMFQEIILSRILSTFNDLNYPTILSTLPANSAEFIVALTEAEQDSSNNPEENAFKRIIAKLAAQPMEDIISWIEIIKDLPNLNPQAVPIFNELLSRISSIQAKETVINCSDIENSRELSSLASCFPFGEAEKERKIKAQNDRHRQGASLALKTWIVLFVFCLIMLFCSKNVRNGAFIFAALPFHLVRYFYPTLDQFDELPGVIFGITALLLMFWMVMFIFSPVYLLTQTTTTLTIINIIGSRFFPDFQPFPTMPINYPPNNSLRSQLFRLLSRDEKRRERDTRQGDACIVEIG